MVGGAAMNSVISSVISSTINSATSPATNSALILFAHGARDPRWAAPFVRLQQIIQSQQPQCRVELAFLEFMSPDLPALVAQLHAENCLDIRLVPIFLGQGGHVLRDLPQILAQLQAHYPQLRLQTLPAVGENEAVLMAIAEYCLTGMP
jgi:sirohydrochlorin cobaltochelatase